MPEPAASSLPPSPLAQSECTENLFAPHAKGGRPTIAANPCRPRQGSVQRFGEGDHLSPLCRVGKTAAAGSEVVGHMLGVAGSGDHRGHRLVAEEVFEEELGP